MRSPLEACSSPPPSPASRARRAPGRGGRQDGVVDEDDLVELGGGVALKGVEAGEGQRHLVEAGDDHAHPRRTGGQPGRDEPDEAGREQADLLAHDGARHPDEPAGDPVRLLDLVVGRAATLAAQYMAAGFVHGVLNSDNINVTGESFDYGPWRFTPEWDDDFTAAYFDHYGLYSFGRQPEAIHR